MHTCSYEVQSFELYICKMFQDQPKKIFSIIWMWYKTFYTNMKNIYGTYTLFQKIKKMIQTKNEVEVKWCKLKSFVLWKEIQKKSFRKTVCWCIIFFWEKKITYWLKTINEAKKVSMYYRNLYINIDQKDFFYFIIETNSESMPFFFFKVSKYFAFIKD